jgi:glucans biosynthesis protein C
MKPEPHISAFAPKSQRYYGLDWLRIAAIIILIFYHILKGYDPVDWVIKSTYRADWAPYLFTFIQPWRMALLFFVSGFATAMQIGKFDKLKQFVAVRSKRLLLPLAFAIAIIVPPQIWVLLSDTHGYSAGYTHFWLHDYLSFSKLYGVVTPDWAHMWFVAYLWLYTMVIIALSKAGFQLRLPHWATKDYWLLLLPIGALIVLKVAVMRIDIKLGYLGYISEHVNYFPCFYLGFIIAKYQDLASLLNRLFLPAISIAGASTAASLLLMYFHPSYNDRSHLEMAITYASETAESWAMILALPALAIRYLNFDHPWRSTLNEAIFPVYIIHQTAIVLMIYWLKPIQLSALSEAAYVTIGTVILCAAFYFIGRSSGPARALIGLSPANTGR